MGSAGAKVDMRKRLLHTGLSCMALIVLASPAMPQAAKPIISQIDHVLFVTPGGSALVSLLTDTLRLPKVWPQQGDTWTASSGIGFGNVTLEVFHRRSAVPRL